MRSYADNHLRYTNPGRYDARAQHPTEQYIRALWEPILKQALATYIRPGSVVADLGCGTLQYTQYMSAAHRIYAVDVSQTMIDFGRPKIASFSNKITFLTENALHTSIPDHTCDLVWTVGLSEYVPLNELWIEMSRLAKSHGRIIIQFPNAYSPYNLAMQCLYVLTGRHHKSFRSLKNMRAAAARQGWNISSITSCGMALPAPAFVGAWLRPLWQIADILVSPLQKYFPIGLNVLAVFER